MNLSPKKTKVIWSVSEKSLLNEAPLDFAASLVNTKADAFKMFMIHSVKNNLVYLKECIYSTLEKTDPHLPHPKGWLPWILGFQGRRCVLEWGGGTSFLELQVGNQVRLVFSLFGSMEVTPPPFQGPTLHLKLSAWDMVDACSKGTLLKVSFGQTEFELNSSLETTSGGQAKWVDATITQGGMLYQHSDVHSAAMRHQLFPLTSADHSALEEEMFLLGDYLMIPGVNSAEELLEIKNRVAKGSGLGSLRHPSRSLSEEDNGNVIPKLLLCVDTRFSVENINKLLVYVDGIVFSRGVLSLSFPASNLPILQKEITAKCNHAGKIIIVENELMHSMRVNPNPTRAEVSDIVNTVADGADAILLDDQVTTGLYANLVAKVTQETIESAGLQENFNWTRIPFTIANDDDAVAWGAIHAAKMSHSRAIVCITEGGYTALRLSSLRTPFDIIVFTYTESVMRQLNLLRTVTALCVQHPEQFERVLDQTKQLLHKYFGFARGHRFVFVSLTASPVSLKNSNLFSIQEID
jgi:pyruvate kinase